MNDLDAADLRPLFEQLAGRIDPVNSDAYLEIIQGGAGAPHIQGNAAGFVCAGIRLIAQGLNSTGIPDGKPLTMDLRRLTIEQDKGGGLID
jgi:hypothetical protein